MRRVLMGAWVGFFVSILGLQANEPVLDSAGLRTGLSTHRPCDRFYQTELYGVRHLPWTAELTPRWTLQPRLEMTAGVMRGRDETGWIGSLGPGMALTRKDQPFSLVAGCRPTLMDRQTFGNKPLGSTIQFTSHIGGAVKLSPRLEMDVRFQHMSNAGINADHNPGLNHFMFSMGYLF